MRMNRTAIDVSPEPTYSGAAKAALVLLAMERGKALDLLKALAPEDVRAIMRRAAELKLIEGPLLDTIITEFEASFNEGVNFIGSADEVRLLVEEALGNDGANLALTTPAVVEAPLDPPWIEVGQLSDDVLKAYISAQHPQAAAFLLSNLEQEKSAELLRSMSPESANDLLSRLLTVKELPKPIQRAFEEAIREDLISKSKSGSGAHQMVASVLNELNQERSEGALDYLSRHRPEDARIVRKLLFKFEDLTRLSARSLGVVVERLPVERIVIALRDASPALQEYVLGAMAPRARRMAESELKNDSPVSAKAAAEAKRIVAQAVLNLAATGAIELPSAEETGS